MSDSGLADPLDDTPTATRSSEGKPLELPKKPIEDVIKGGVVLVSEGLHKLLARTELEQAEDVWLMQEKEAGQIGAPLARIGKRHGALSGLGDAGDDVGDLLEAGVYVLAYVFKNGVRAWQLRRAARQMSETGISPAGEGDES